MDIDRILLRIVLILSVALINRSFGAVAAHSRRDWQTDHRALIHDAADGRLDDFSLIHASLLVTPEIDGYSASHWLGQFQWHVQQCATQLPHGGDQTTRAEAVFAYMHDQILTRQYREDITSIRHSLRNGSYNCVSSTLIYICLCRALGIPAQAVALPTHVFVKLQLPSPILIETTYPRWSVLAPDDRRIDQIEYLREISDVALLGRLFYNEGIALAKRCEFSQAVEAARLSCQFDPAHHAAHANLLATLNNWSLSLCRAGEYERAAQLVTHGLSLNASYGPLRANDVYVHQMWIAALRRAGHQQQAEAIEQALLQRLQTRQNQAQSSIPAPSGRI